MNFEGVKLIVADVVPTTTVTYTGAQLTSFLLNGGTPETIGGSNSGSSNTAISTTPTETPSAEKTAQVVPGTQISSADSESPATSASYAATSSSDAFQAASSSTDFPVASSSTAIAVDPTSVSNASSHTPSSYVTLSTPAIVGIVVGSVGLIAVIALILFLLAGHKLAKDRQRLRDNHSDEKSFSESPSPQGKNGVVTQTRPTDPFRDDNNTDNNKPAPKGALLNPAPRQADSVVTASFDFGGLVPTKNNYGKDGKPIINAVWDEREVGRPFSLTRVPSPSSTVAEVGDETPINFMSRTKTPSPSKLSAGTTSETSTPRSGQSTNSSTRGYIPAQANIKRKPSDRQFPISRPISPFDDQSSMNSNSPLRAAPRPAMKTTNSNSSIASTASSIRKPRPSPIQVPPVHPSDSRDSIIIDKNVSPPMTLPPSIPTPPLPSLEFRKEWERLKRDSTASADSTDTCILDETSDDAADPKVQPKMPLQSQQSLTNVPLPTRSETMTKTIPRTVIVAPQSPPKAPNNPGDILKKEKTLLRVPSAASSLSSSSNSSIASSNGGAAPPNKRSPSIVAATAKWAEKRKALNAVLASQHNARAAKNDPLPQDAVEKVQEARKSAQGLAPAAPIEEGRVASPRKRDVEGRKGVDARNTESVGSPTLSVFKCYDPERESTFVPGEALNMMRAMDMEDKENMPFR